MRQEDTDWDPLFLDPFLGVGCRLSQVPWRRSDLFQWALQRLLFIAPGLDRVDLLFGTGCLRMPGKRPLNDFIVSCAFLVGQQTFFKLVLLTLPAQTAVCLIPVESNCVINFSAFPVGVSPTPHTLHLPAPSPTPLPIPYPGKSSHLSFRHCLWTFRKAPSFP